MLWKQSLYPAGLSLYTCAHTRTYTRVRTHAHTHPRTYAHIRVRTHAHMHTRTYAHIHVRTFGDFGAEGAVTSRDAMARRLTAHSRRLPRS